MSPGVKLTLHTEKRGSEKVILRLAPFASISKHQPYQFVVSGSSQVYANPPKKETHSDDFLRFVPLVLGLKVTT